MSARRVHTFFYFEFWIPDNNRSCSWVQQTISDNKTGKSQQQSANCSSDKQFLNSVFSLSDLNQPVLESDDRMSADKSTMTMRLGESSEIVCIAAGKPTARYVWTKDGEWGGECCVLEDVLRKLCSISCCQLLCQSANFTNVWTPTVSVA